MEKLGRSTYLVSYSLVSVAALGWVFHAAFQLEYIELWPPSPWHAWISLVLSPVGLFFLVTGLASPNPISVSLRKEDQRHGAVVSITRHPVLWGFLLWALGHLVANGDLRSVLLFGVFAAFAVFGMAMSERRHFGHPLMASTSIVPFAALLRGRARLRVDAFMILGVLLAGSLTSALLLGGHSALFGADPLAMAGG